MTRRVVIFQGQSGWFATPEFNGDKSEFEHFCMGDTCDANWAEIAARFFRAKTLSEFKKANEWAQGLYHSQFGPSQYEDVERFHFGDTTPDEVLMVYEDLGVAGFWVNYLCRTCNCMHTFLYEPSGKVSAPGFRCYCGALVAPNPFQPSAEAWADAIGLYKGADGLVWSSLLGLPGQERQEQVEICKISRFDEHGFLFEVRLPNGEVVTVPRSGLEPAPGHS